MHISKISACIALLFLCLCQIACYSYRTRTVKTNSDSEADIFRDLAESSSGLLSWRKSPRKGDLVALDRYYVTMGGGRPLARLNNYAVDLALQERYYEAEILLHEALEEDHAEPALHNNLGVVCELSGKLEEASAHYMRASLRAGGDLRIRANYLRFSVLEK